MIEICGYNVEVSLLDWQIQIQLLKTFAKWQRKRYFYIEVYLFYFDKGIFPMEIGCTGYLTALEH